MSNNGATSPSADLGDSAGDDVVINDLLNAELSTPATEGTGVEEQLNAKKPPKRAPAKKKAAKEKVSTDEAGDPNELPSLNAADTKLLKKRTPAKKKVTADSDDVESGLAPAPSPKKRATPKKKEPAAVADGEEPEAGAAPTPTPKKKRAYKKKEVVVTVAGGEDGEGTPVQTVTKKAPKPKPTPKSKVKVETGDDEAGAEDAGPSTPVPKAVRKRKTGESDSSSPKKRNKSEAIGATYEDLNAADKLTIRLRLDEKKGWPEIEAIVEKETGVRHGKDVLRKSRWPKLEAVSVQFSDEDILAFLAVKVKVDKVKVDKSYWNHVSDEMKNAGITLSAKVLEAKYKWLQENNRIDANGSYIAPVSETTPPTSPAADAAGTADGGEMAQIPEAAAPEIQADGAADADVEAEFQNGEMLDFEAEDEILDV